MIKLVLTNTKNNLSCEFLDYQFWREEMGVYSLNQNCYYDTSSKTFKFALKNYSGLLNNSIVSNFFQNGIAENGSTFNNNIFTSRIVQLEYLPSFVQNEDGISATSYLNALLNTQDTILELRIITNNNIYLFNCVSTENTNTETGTIQLQSAFSKSGIYFREELINEKLEYYNRNLNNYFLPLYLPAIPLSKIKDGEYKSFEIFSRTTSEIESILISSELHEYTSFEMINELTNQSFSFNNNLQKDILIKPKERKFFKIENGNEIEIKRSDIAFSGSLINFESGFNNFKFKFTGKTNLNDFVKLEYYKYFDGVE